MRVYVRVQPFRQPVALDVGPTETVAELRMRVGAEALYSLPFAHSRRSRAEGSLEALPRAPLEESARVSALVSAHATLVGSRTAVTVYSSQVSPRRPSARGAPLELPKLGSARAAPGAAEVVALPVAPASARGAAHHASGGERASALPRVLTAKLPVSPSVLEEEHPQGVGSTPWSASKSGSKEANPADEEVGDDDDCLPGEALERCCSSTSRPVARLGSLARLRRRTFSEGASNVAPPRPSESAEEPRVEETLVFAWGDNSQGQCWPDSGSTAFKSPTRVRSPSSCSSMCCGRSNSIFVTEHGGLWGQGHCGSCHREKKLELPEVELHRVSAVAAGTGQLLAITDDGTLLACGLVDPPEDCTCQHSSPSKMMVWPPANMRHPLRVVAAACGESHSLALTESGEIFAFGSNEQGQLGLGERVKKAAEPLQVGGRVRGLPMRGIAAGTKHSLAFTVSGDLYSWGDNTSGCLGLGAASSQARTHQPAAVPGLPGPCRFVAAGGSHSAVIVGRGHALLAGCNAWGQLGWSRSAVPCSMEFRSASAASGLCVRSAALGQQHTLLLAYDGKLYACGRNAEGQCGTGQDVEVVESPTRVVLQAAPPPPGGGRPAAGGGEAGAVVWSVAAGEHHTVALCMAGEARLPRMMAAVAPDRPLPGFLRRHRAVAPCTPPPSHELRKRSGRRLLRKADDGTLVRLQPSVPARPIVHPGVATQRATAFTSLSVDALATLAAQDAAAPCGAAAPPPAAARALCAALARPSVLNASFCYPGLGAARLDIAGLCQQFKALFVPGSGTASTSVLEAATEGLRSLASGRVSELVHGDQLRALAVYLCLPVRSMAAEGELRPARAFVGRIAHLVTQMPAAGRGALRDLLVEECGDAYVFREFLVPQARALAEDAIRHASNQPWLGGPLWEVVGQLQLQRPLWEAVLLLQLLVSASQEAGRAARSQRDGDGPDAQVGLLEPSEFRLEVLAEGPIPPEVEFWLFQEHAHFHQVTPTDVVEERVWVDAAGMLPRHFCSFMAHANLVPIAFKQRVLQVENALRQRLSQEQALWPSGDLTLGSLSLSLDPSSIYLVLNVRREELLSDTFQQVCAASPADLRRPLRVNFVGEEAVDEGGVTREFFRVLSQELFAPSAGLFFEAEGSRRLWFAPEPGDGKGLDDYWMVGVIVALAVYNNHPGLHLHLPSALFKKLKDEETGREDLAQLFPEQARSFEALLRWAPSRSPAAEGGLEAADEEFAATFCISHCLAPPGPPGAALPEVPLCEGGADRLVRYSDRESFVEAAQDYLLHGSVAKQFGSFAHGFRRICNSHLFSVLSASELESIVAGEADLDFACLRQGTHYEGFSATEQYISDFWDVLEGFSMLQRRRFLAFCTGSDVAPAGGLQDLRLLVQRHGEEPTRQLPTAHTCFNLLLLPRYESAEKLSAMLTTAMEWSEGFGLQ